MLPRRPSTWCQGLPARPASSITNRYLAHSTIVLLHQCRRHSHPHQISNRKARVPGLSHLITIDLTISMLYDHTIPLYDSLVTRLLPVASYKWPRAPLHKTPSDHTPRHWAMKFFMSLPHRRLDHGNATHTPDDAALEDTIDGAGAAADASTQSVKIVWMDSRCASLGL